MKRILIDYKKLPPELTLQLVQTYPDGYGDDDIIAFKNLKGEIIEAVELHTPETLYLVKISQSLSHFISHYEEVNEEESSEETMEAMPETEESYEGELEGQLDLE